MILAAPLGEAAPEIRASSGPLTTVTEPLLRDRAAFIRALARVKVGASHEEVRKLLGEPDDRWVGDEVNACRRGMVFREGKEAWAYGGDGHLTFPTLGKISFDAAGKVVTVDGRGGKPPSPALPPEAETRRILRLIDRLKGYDQSNDPLRVIQVVNALQPLGKAGALAVIDEYLRVADRREFGGGPEGLFVVVRSLFNVPDPPGYLPMMMVGGPSPDAPVDPKRSPRFPVVLYQDIPFVGINGYALFGAAETIEAHLESFRKTGTIRAQPLRPPDNPLEIIDALTSSKEWPDWGAERAWGRSIAREQVLRLVTSAYPVEDLGFDFRLRGSYEKQDPQWQTHLQRFREIKAHWDAARNTYVRADGTFLAPVPEPYTYPRVWRVHLRTGAIQVSLQRQGSRVVDVSLASYGAKPPMPRVRIFVGAAEVKIRLGLTVPQRGGLLTGFSASADSDIRLVLEHDGKVLAETVLRP